MQIRSFLSVLLLIVPLMGLTSCYKKKKCENKNSKMAQSVGKGFPLSGSKKNMKHYGDDLDAFILDDEESVSPQSVKLNGRQQLAFYEDEGSRQAFVPVVFDFDRYEIRKDQEPVVQLDVETAKVATAEGKVLKVEGHADKHYISELYNLAVSQKRAHTMANKLAESGIDKDALKPVGFGATRPAVDLPGKVEANRRVEIVALGA